MKVHLALAALIAQASGASTAVFPAPGEHVSYVIHDTIPRGGSYDTTLTLAGGSAASVVVSSPGNAQATVALDNGQPAHLDRSIGMGFHLLEVANAVVQAGMAGRESVLVHFGPPNAEPDTLSVKSSGGTIVATGNVSMPPPPQMGGDRNGPPQGGPPPAGSSQGGPPRELSVKIVATVVNGKLSNARGDMSPAGNRGPQHSWTVTRKP